MPLTDRLRRRKTRIRVELLLFATAIAVAACQSRSDNPAAVERAETRSAASDAGETRFRDVSEPAGLVFRHFNGATAGLLSPVAISGLETFEPEKIIDHKIAAVDARFCSLLRFGLKPKPKYSRWNAGRKVHCCSISSCCITAQ